MVRAHSDLRCHCRRRLYFLFCQIYPTWHRFDRLVRNGIHVRGRVTAKERHNHQLVRYEYNAGGGHYTGTATAGLAGLAPFDKIRVGDEIDVTCLPEQPSVSTAGNARLTSGSWFGALFVIVPLFLVLLC